MANTKDINSTERLLNVIRGVQKSPEETADEGKQNSFKKIRREKTAGNFSKVFTGKRHIKIGVEIGTDEVCFAKMTKSSDSRPLLMDQKIEPYQKTIDTASDEFQTWLKDEFAAFVGTANECEVWAMMNASDVNVQHLKIPIVPKKQLDNVVYWTAKKENPIDEKDVIFDYEMQGEVNDQGIAKYSVMAYSAPKADVEKVKKIFSSIGVNLAGITIAPFAIQNIFRTKWTHVSEKTFASLYIGQDFSRIDIFNKNNLVLTRGIKTGVSSMLEAIEESIVEGPAGDRIEKDRILKNLYALFSDTGKTVRDEKGIVWSENAVREMITPALDRLVRQIERTIEYYTTSVGFEKVEKIYISAVRNPFHLPLLQYMREQMAVPAEFFDCFQGRNAESGASLTLGERTALVPVVGLALSDRKYTPNILFTYVEKNKESRMRRINRGIFSAFAAALAVCCVVLIWQAVTASNLNEKKNHLDKELSRMEPKLSKEKINAMANELKLRHLASQSYAKKYRATAVIGELSYLTPDNIRLTGLQIILPTGGQTVSKNKKSPGKAAGEDVIIDGVVLGERNALDSTLAQYIMKLENSPVLRGVVLQKSAPANFKKKEILKFTINAKIG